MQFSPSSSEAAATHRAENITEVPLNISFCLIWTMLSWRLMQNARCPVYTWRKTAHIDLIEMMFRRTISVLAWLTEETHIIPYYGLPNLWPWLEPGVVCTRQIHQSAQYCFICIQILLMKQTCFTTECKLHTVVMAVGLYVKYLNKEVDVIINSIQV